MGLASINNTPTRSHDYSSIQAFFKLGDITPENMTVFWYAKCEKNWFRTQNNDIATCNFTAIQGN